MNKPVDAEVVLWPKVAALFRWAGRLTAVLLGAGTVVTLFAGEPLSPLTLEAVQTDLGAGLLAVGIGVLLSLPFLRALAIFVEGQGRGVRGILLAGTAMAAAAYAVALIFSH